MLMLIHFLSKSNCCPLLSWSVWGDQGYSNYVTSSVADPGFPVGGRQSRRGDGAPTPDTATSLADPGGAPGARSPKGPNSFVLTYKFYET